LFFLDCPENLGEAKHLLANQSDVYYWLGIAFDAIGDALSARLSWEPNHAADVCLGRVPVGTPGSVQPIQNWGTRIGSAQISR